MRPIPTLALVAAAALAAGCASMPEPQITGWKPQAPGASWEVAQKNTGSFGRDQRFTITRAPDGTWQGRPVVTMKSSLGPATLMDPSTGHWYAIVAGDGKPLVSYDPPIGWQYPVKVGSEWQVRHAMTNHANGARTDFTLSCKAEAFEKVTVPAGSFDAFRIRCLTSGGADETYWSDAATGLFVKTRLVRPATDPRGAGTQESELQTRPAAR